MQPESRTLTRADVAGAGLAESGNALDVLRESAFAGQLALFLLPYLFCRLVMFNCVLIESMVKLQAVAGYYRTFGEMMAACYPTGLWQGKLL